MNPNLVNDEVQQKLRLLINEDSRNISLKKSEFNNISSSEFAKQLKGMKIAKSKFPFLFETNGIYYPPSINLEQASSQSTAVYKSKMLTGNLLIDLTAGMGIDAYFFSKSFKKVIAVERNTTLCEISKHNYRILNTNNLFYENTDLNDFLTENPTLKSDVIYLDPSRRNSTGRKFLIEDLEPNIIEYIDRFFEISSTIMVKLSPLTDLKKTINQIKYISEIHIVAVNNELKELLIICKNKTNENPKVTVVNLETQQPVFEFYFNDEKEIISEFSEPLKYIYEPNPGILKSGAFKLCGQKFGLKKLETNTHLYTSDELKENFPGKIYEVIEEIHHPKKSIYKKSFHIISKNHPMKAEEIRNKYKIKQSEEETLIFTKSISGKVILKAKKVFTAK